MGGGSVGFLVEKNAPEKFMDPYSADPPDGLKWFLAPAMFFFWVGGGRGNTSILPLEFRERKTSKRTEQCLPTTNHLEIEKQRSFAQENSSPYLRKRPKESGLNYRPHPKQLCECLPRPPPPAATSQCVCR